MSEVLERDGSVGPGVRFSVNGEPREVVVPGMRRLLDVLREDLGLTGTKEGCGEGECGACSVIVDGLVVDSCLVPVCQVEGRIVRTVEGLSLAGQGAEAALRELEKDGDKEVRAVVTKALAGMKKR